VLEKMKKNKEIS